MSYQTHTNKVSMVMPCYNKARYIGKMFDSILAQKYDNIELILVNDGSTDGTRDIIWDYSDKFRDRGFEVTIIEQENKGLCGAIKAGFLHITGDFVCSVDADDELNPEYVSLPVEVMTKDETIAYTVCDSSYDTVENMEKGVERDMTPQTVAPPPDSWRNYVSYKIMRAPWARVIRREYFDKVKIVDFIKEHRTVTHELYINLPLFFGGGKNVFINKRLYYYREVPGSHSSNADIRNGRLFHDNSLLAMSEVLQKLFSDKDEYKKYYNEAEAYEYTYSAKQFVDINPDDPNTEYMVENSKRAVNELFGTRVTDELIKNHIDFYCNFVYNLLSGEPNPYSLRKGRVIGYGTLGKIAAKLLPICDENNLNFDLLWDSAAAPGDAWHEKAIESPDFDSVGPDDNVIVFPANNKDIIDNLSKTGCKIIPYYEINTVLSLGVY